MKRQLKYYLIGLIICFCYLTSLGQQNKIDSLLTLLKTAKQDTIKVNTLSNLFLQYEFTDTLKAKKYLNNALELSQKINYKKGESNTYLYLGYLAEDKGNYSEALKNYFASLKIKEVLGDKKGLAASYNNIGIIYEDLDNYPEALKNYSSALKIRKAIGDKKGMAGSYQGIGIVYFDQGNYTEALKNYFAALKIREAIGDKVGTASSYQGIGVVYKNQGNLPDARINYLVALKIYEVLGDKKGISNSFNNIGNIYYAEANYPQALKNYFASLKIREALGDKIGVGSSYSNIGNVYGSQGNYPEALKNYFASLKIRETIGNKKGIIGSYINIGDILTKQKQYKEAEEYLNKAVELSKEIGYKNYLKDSYRGLTELDSAKNNFKSAYENHKLYILYRDSLDNEETRKKTIQSQMTFDFDKKEAATKAEQEKKDTIATEEKRRQKVITYSVTGGLLLVLLLALFIFRGYRQKQKANQELASKNLVIEEQKKLVEEKNKDITDSINYAKRIQEAFLIPESEIKKQFLDAFVLFNPKDIVSGDIYWFAESKYNKVLVVADCTGHGVPGGFMSMLSFAMLQETLLLEEVKTTAQALTFLDHKITETLNRNNRSYRDGMDMTLCAFSKSANTLQFSCANRPLILIRNGELKEFSADKFTIGGAIDNVSKNFRNQEIQIEQGDLIYLFSDGYVDQFGGPKGKKFKNKQLNEKLLAICHHPLAKQKEILEQTFNNWKGSLEQVDDVCVIGIRL